MSSSPRSSSPPSGFRDFLPKEARRRERLKRIISDAYEAFGFAPIDTPALENIEILCDSGGGEENEKLIFKVLKRGEKLKAAIETQAEDQLSDLGLRFDLTVPLSRIVAQYRSEIHFPWKVYHIASVWRAERAQKGRFREFTQCDVDIIGSKSSSAELEVIQTVASALAKTGVDPFELRLNDRRLLTSIAESFGFTGALVDRFSVILDKKDKVKPEEIRAELDEVLGRKCSADLDELLNGSFGLNQALKANPEVTTSLQKLIEQIRELELPFSSVTFDPSLARGLSYYTGPVFELRHPSAGYSLGGGGRYDRLIGKFSKQEIPACGFSIGFDRLLLLLSEAKSNESPRIFVPVFDEGLRTFVSAWAQKIRSNLGVAVDVFADEAKVKAQFKYASDEAYRWVLIVGEEERANQLFKLKDFASGQESLIQESELISHLKNLLLPAGQL